MENIILEMRKIIEESKEEASLIKTRNKLKEYLHYFVLDFIYNSESKDMVFYGGSCLRIVYDLPRMSIDLDFEAEEKTNFEKFKKSLEKYFSADLGLKNKFYIKGEKKGKNVNRIFLNFPLMNDLGLSSHRDEVLRVRIDIMSVSKNYIKKLVPVFTLKSKYGKSLVIKHYDLSTLFASKLAAILDRPQKGFIVGKKEENIDFKGRDFYDLIWYMERKVLPNKHMLKLKGVKGSTKDLFDDIALFISERKLKKGLKKDLEPLFLGSVNSFVDNFKHIFQRLKENY
jgi:predicted nucleotidyltransferase component of viral defense system